ncbi:MAG: hypothetical protein ABSB22_14545 [Thermodesulfobacteriota bacterium]|jgi:hypothetical protein
MLSSKKLIILLVASSLSVFVSLRPASAQYSSLLEYWLKNFYYPRKPIKEKPILNRELLAEAVPDECFNGIGNPYPQGPPCPDGSIPKVNQAYVWALTKLNDTLWFGTYANPHCLAIGAFFPLPHQTSSWVCEFGRSSYPAPISLPDATRDFRPPKIYSFDTASGTLSDRTPVSGVAKDLIEKTFGIRSASHWGEVIFLGGPCLNPTPPAPPVGGEGINLFAFHATTGELIGAKNLPEYSDIRTWVVEKGVLYAGVRNSEGGGSVLRWRGNLDDLFQFEVVGKLDSEAASMVSHQGRLFVTTWPGSNGATSLYMSPPIPDEGLTSGQLEKWSKVWDARDYEPDPVTATTYYGGALASFKGYLYWGTLHAPGQGLMAALSAHDNHLIDLDENGNGVLDLQEFSNAALGTYRAFSLFRGRNFGRSNQKVQLLYGQKFFPVYDPVQKKYTVADDTIHRNRMPNPSPKWGKSGVGNFFNAYVWSMAVYRNHLYIGTFDWRPFLDQEFIEAMLKGFSPDGSLDSVIEEVVPLLQLLKSAIDPGTGADLYRVNGLSLAAPESVRGLGNPVNFGIRTLLADDALYVGTANAMNLLADPNDHPLKGGWELIRLKRK